MMELLHTLGQVLIAFVVLGLVYMVIYKGRRKVGPVRSRVRLWAYLLIFLVPLWWLARNVPYFPHQETVARYLLYFLIADVIIFFVEFAVAFAFDFMLARRKLEVSAILRDVTKGIAYVIILFILMWAVFKVDITPFLTTSAIFSIIIGLALQETLGNLFSGLTLHMSRPFSAGDWITAGQYEGRVEKIDWRAITLLNLVGDHIVIPNGVLAKTEITNYSSPTVLHARRLRVGVHYQHPPNRVLAVLRECILKTSGVCLEPPPQIWMENYGDYAIVYVIKFWIDDYPRHPEIESNILKQIWYHFKREEIKIPFPTRELYHYQGSTLADQAADKLLMLRRVDFLDSLSEEEMRLVAEMLRVKIYAADEVIFHQGDAGHTFYIIVHGRVSVRVTNEWDQEITISELGSGDFFGEISVLTGELRTATILALEDVELLALEREDLAYLMRKYSTLDEHVSRILVQRKQNTAERRHFLDRLKREETAGSTEMEEDSLNSRLLSRIRSFFSF